LNFSTIHFFNSVITPNNWKGLRKIEGDARLGSGYGSWMREVGRKEKRTCEVKKKKWSSKM